MKGAVDMRLLDESTMVIDRPAADIEQPCPECGTAMVECDRRMDDGVVLIWYACPREDCTGRRLAKKAPRMCGV